jgi:hypothetical protein
MNHRALTTLALRLTGVAVLVKILPYASTTFIALIRIGASTPNQAMMLTAFAVIIPLVVGLALIYFPASLTTMIAGASTAAEDEEIGDRLGQIAAIVIGIYFLATGVFDLVYLASRHWLFNAVMHRDDLDPELTSLDFASLVTAAVQLVAGAILAFKAQTLYRWISRVRETRPK